MADTPISDMARANGVWNDAWNDAEALDPEWVESFLAMGTLPIRRGVLEPKVY